FYDGTNTYYMVGTQYFIYNSEGDTVTKIDNTSKWGLVQNNILDNLGVNAGYNDGTNVYLFSDNQYYQYTPGSDVVTDGYPKLLAENDLGIPTSWGTVDAAFKGQDGQVYFFNNDLGMYKVKGGTEDEIGKKWGIFTNNFTDSSQVPIVASFIYNEKLYAFNGAQWLRYKELTVNSSGILTGATLEVIKSGDFKGFLMEEFGFAESELSGYDGKTVLSAGMYGTHILSVYLSDRTENHDTFDLSSKQKVTYSRWEDEKYFNDNDTVFSYFDSSGTDIRIFSNGQDNGSFYLRRHETYIGSSFKIKDTDGNKLTIDSAFVYKDMAYLICGDKYWVLDTSVISLTDPKDVSVMDIGATQVKDTFALDLSFSTVDAAFVLNSLTYLISGKNYLKYSGETYGNADSLGTMDSLIPNLPTGWDFTIDSAFPYTDGKYYLFNTLKNQSVEMETDFDISNQEETITVNWGQLNPSNFDASTIDAAYVRDNKAYLFSGSRFIVHTITNGEVDKYMEGTSLEIANGITEVSAAFVLNGHAYLISGSQYYRIESGETPDSFSHTGSAIKGSWGNLPSDLNSGMTAALDKDGKLYFFKNGQFIDYEIGGEEP
ncbi:MAG: hemopexin repeat-containing protein, partial [Bacteroidota bacterium]